MTHMVHPLQINDDGMPLEIYAFLMDTAWVDFEMVAAAMIEHIYATLPHFGLRPFQRPLSVNIGDLPPVSA